MATITLDIFNNDAFAVTTMLDPVNKMPYQPSFLEQFFTPEPVSTDTVGVGLRQGQLTLIPTTQRGAPIEVAEPETRNVRPFLIPRVAKGDKLRAHEIADVTPMEGQSELESVQAILARKQQGLVQDCEYTFEHMRLGAIQGKVVDADGSTVLTNYWTEWGIAEPSEIDVGLDNASVDPGATIRAQIVRPLIRAAGASPATRIIGLAGDAFYDALIGHGEVRKTYLNWQAASDLRNQSPFETFRYGGVDWINYRGSDDNSEIAIDTDDAVIFPTNVPRMFRHVMGPFNEVLNMRGQPGRRVYPLIVRDKDRDMWVQPEIYSYPLMLNTRPDLILRATRQ